MKKSTLLLLCLLTAVATLSSQKRERITVKGSEANSYCYIEPEFTEGTIIMNDGRTLRANMNFNLYTCQMQFIEPKEGAILDIGNTDALVMISLGERKFYYIDGHYLVYLTNTTTPMLAATPHIVIANAMNEGPFGTTKNESASHSMGSLQNQSGANMSLSSTREYTLERNNFYFFVDNGKAVKAGRRALLKLLPKHKNAIQQYIDSHKTDFEDEACLKELLEYCTQLSTQPK